MYLEGKIVLSWALTWRGPATKNKSCTYMECKGEGRDSKGGHGIGIDNNKMKL